MKVTVHYDVIVKTEEVLRVLQCCNSGGKVLFYANRLSSMEFTEHKYELFGHKLCGPGQGGKTLTAWAAKTGVS